MQQVGTIETNGSLDVNEGRIGGRSSDQLAVAGVETHHSRTRDPVADLAALETPTGRFELDRLLRTTRDRRRREGSVVA